MSKDLKNKKLLEKYEKKYGSQTINAIRRDYRKQFRKEPPFWPGDLDDAMSKYTLEQTIDIYLTALRKAEPYELKEGDIISCDEF
ncbi:hypothetical protein GOQ29_09380 [Clostridium sp. D2Q-14]|uniref:hypothetical protein n=1 Tax=Anaeromonas gelatinilytica TaxID=2683194 RepID=UPI00193C0E5A|nr:hypothetical protein [Anaeromonas gelatinilytica]MBS4535825.1 hypothetical protein [Anaeromonas gelatinilytica]